MCFVSGTTETNDLVWGTSHRLESVLITHNCKDLNGEWAGYHLFYVSKKLVEVFPSVVHQTHYWETSWWIRQYEFQINSMFLSYFLLLARDLCTLSWRFTCGIKGKSRYLKMNNGMMIKRNSDLTFLEGSACSRKNSTYMNKGRYFLYLNTGCFLTYICNSVLCRTQNLIRTLLLIEERVFSLF